MGSSNMRDRLGRVTDAPAQAIRSGLGRGHGSLPREGDIVEQHGGPMSGLRDQLGHVRQQTPSLHDAARGAQEAARGAAGRAGSAMAGAAGMAARAGQSAGSALAGRMSDVSSRIAEHDDLSWTRGMRAGGRSQERDEAAQPAARRGHRPAEPRRDSAIGDSAIRDRVMRDRAVRDGAVRDGAVRDRAVRQDAMRDSAIQESWPLAEELAAGHGARGVSKRQRKQLQRARDAADEAAHRAAEASERALRHGRSRRAHKSERKAAAQADRAWRTLDEHLTRAERQVASSKRRRRRGLGLVMVAGAAAGIAIAARRMLNQPGRRPSDQAGTSPADLTAPSATRYPADDRMPQSMRDDLTLGRGAGTMSDSTPRRF
jgi:hypothetical protein